MSEENEKKAKGKQGFASMSLKKRRAVAAKGGRKVHENGTGNRFTSTEAQLAGRKGGKVLAANREHMVEIGRKGGLARWKQKEKPSVDVPPTPVVIVFLINGVLQSLTGPTVISYQDIVALTGNPPNAVLSIIWTTKEGGQGILLPGMCTLLTEGMHFKTARTGNS